MSKKFAALLNFLFCEIIRSVWENIAFRSKICDN